MDWGWAQHPRTQYASGSTPLLLSGEGGEAVLSGKHRNAYQSLWRVAQTLPLYPIATQAFPGLERGALYNIDSVASFNEN